LNRSQHLSIKRSAAALLAAAMTEYYPNVQLLGPGSDGLLFYYDFIFPHPLPPEGLSLLEEHMKKISKEGRSYSHKEMLASVAKEYLLHHNLTHRAKKVEGLEGCVDIFQYGDFVDWAIGDFVVPSFSFQLLRAEVLGKNRIRIVGTAAPDTKQVKGLVKKISSYDRHSARYLAENKGLIFPSTTSWNSKGCRFLEEILSFFRSGIEKEGGQFVRFDSNEDRISWVKDHPDQRIFEIVHKKNEGSFSLFETKYQTELQEIICTNSDIFEKEWISSLKFIAKLLSILGLKHELFLCPRATDSVQRRVRMRYRDQILKAMKASGIQCQSDEESEGSSLLEFRLKDGLEREWVGATIDLLPMMEGFPLIRRSTAVSLERILALLLESTLGEYKELFPAVQS